MLYLALALGQVFDAIATVDAVGAGAEEANPVMRYFLLTYGVPGFVAAKLLLTWPGLAFLYRHRDLALVNVGVHVLAIVYVLVLAWHGLGRI